MKIVSRLRNLVSRKTEKVETPTEPKKTRGRRARLVIGFILYWVLSFAVRKLAIPVGVYLVLCYAAEQGNSALGVLPYEEVKVVKYFTAERSWWGWKKSSERLQVVKKNGWLFDYAASDTARFSEGDLVEYRPFTGFKLVGKSESAEELALPLPPPPLPYVESNLKQVPDEEPIKLESGEGPRVPVKEAGTVKKKIAH